MQEASPWKIGDQVTLEGRDEFFLVVDLNQDAHTASLLPSKDGKIIDNIAWETLKFYRGLEA